MHRGPLEEKKRRCVAVNASIMHPPAFWIARAWGGPMYTHSPLTHHARRSGAPPRRQAHPLPGGTSGAQSPASLLASRSQGVGGSAFRAQWR